jgi:hypothetical protein
MAFRHLDRIPAQRRSGALPLVTLLSALALACTKHSEPKPVPKVAARVIERPQLASVEQPLPSVVKDVPWIAFGGGSDPLSNQVSLSQDIGLVSTLLEGPGLVLFASGKDAQLSVDRDVPERKKPDLRTELARVLGTPDSYRTDYREARIAIDGPSTSEHVRHALARALSEGDAPLFVYGGSHGSPGETVADNSLSLWGGWPLTVKEVAGLLDSAHGKRPVRFVITACYGGGFADLLFSGADAAQGPRAQDHCGLFAAPADDEASGCDPNPDRRAQESYAIHFLHALEGKDRTLRPRIRDIDVDGDGQVSLLEAHTFARITSRSFDIPTTTSERYLRHATKDDADAPVDPLSAPEEVWVIRALGGELELHDETSARKKFVELEGIFEDAGKQVDDAQKLEDDAFYALRIALLERYPLLEHPWEARTAALLSRDGDAILKLLTESELSAAHKSAQHELGEAVTQHDAVRVARARVLRLVRAFETLRLASVVYKRGGAAKEQYDRLRRCERWMPPLRKKR